MDQLGEPGDLVGELALEDAPTRVTIRCRRCGALSATIRAADSFGPVLLAYVPESKDERDAVNRSPAAAGLERVDPVRTVDFHFLDHPTMTAVTGPAVIVCAGKGGRDLGHGPLVVDVAELLDLYRTAGQQPAEAKLDPTAGP